jgi:lysophospholipase L1-like esterase
MIIGDSIAAGTAEFRRECSSYAIVGINSQQWARKFADLDIAAQTVIISLGSNDSKTTPTRAELVVLRRRTQASRVFWIQPAIKPHVQEIVAATAQEFGDTVVTITELGKDHVHPTTRAYRTIAQETR